MFKNNQQSHSSISASTRHQSRWGNKSLPQADAVSIDFDKNVTPFVESEDDVVDEHELQRHRQQVADDIQLQLTGVTSSVNGNEPLLQPDEPNANALQRALAVVSRSPYLALLVVFVHLLVITLVVLFGRVDISGMSNIPVTEPATKSLPALKSYLITQAEYDKLVERAQANVASQVTQPDAGIAAEMDQSEVTPVSEVEPITTQ